jgi:sterol desaturase/sphingolipid hydroxylase (fatty acid hydroxylase superfamily)
MLREESNARSRSGFVTWFLLGGLFLALTLFERRRPLRATHEPGLRRLPRNLAVAGLAAITVSLVERPIVAPLARMVARRRWGLLFCGRLPGAIHAALAVLLLDYTLYLWHGLVHRVPWLWRFHLVHHVDLDLDASTAIRFHFGELALSVPWRAAQILAIGVTPGALRAWQDLVLASVMFHHSNVRLPLAVERFLGWLIVTPRMHGIHHSIVPDEAGSNWSSGFALWDRIHGTLRLNVPQREIAIGVPAYRDPEDVVLPKILEMPFIEQRQWWQLPGGDSPRSPPTAAPRRELLP